MKKIKVTKKQIIESFPFVIKTSYCSLQNLLHTKNASFYTSGINGWNSDIYVINDNTAIVTGYRPFGNVAASYEIEKKYNDKASKIIALYPLKINYETMQIELNILINDFIKEVTK